MTDTTTEPSRYRELVDAIQWTGDNADQIKGFLRYPQDFALIEDPEPDYLPGVTAAVLGVRYPGWHGLKPGDWLVREPGGEVKVVTEKAFRDHYEDAEPAPHLLCLGCLIEQHQGARTQSNPAAAIVGGQSTCLEHLQFADGPLIPGRTPSGIILGNGS